MGSEFLMKKIGVVIVIRLADSNKKVHLSFESFDNKIVGSYNCFTSCSHKIY